MDCVRIVNNLWTAEEVMDQPKLCVLKELVGRMIETRYVEVMRKMRGVLTKLGGGAQQNCRWRWGEGENGVGRRGIVLNAIV